MKRGCRNKVTDVRGVRIGHKTIAVDGVQTGVMVILLTGGDILRERLTAPYHVISGFGETGGLIQLEELSVLENPIALTNTLYMGIVQQTLVRYMLQDHPEIGTTSGTVNVVVGECSDGYLGDMRTCSIQESDVYETITDAGKDFVLGAVGAGRGMSYFEVEGGIGSTSRVLELNGEEYTVGLLVLSSFGLKNDYIKGNVSFYDSMKGQVEQGNIVIILAAGIPMSDRQLKRIYKRMPVTLARFGLHLGNGNDDIAIAFSTADKVPHSTDCSSISQTILHERQIGKVFRAGIEVCEETIQSSLDAAEVVVGRESHCRCDLKDAVAKMKKG